MKLSTKANYKLSYIIWDGIDKQIDQAIAKKSKEQLSILEELVEYYTEEIILSADTLQKKLEMLKRI